MVIIGIPFAMSYNQSACLLIDGELVGWTEEERLTRIKHSVEWDHENNRPNGINPPLQSVRWLLQKHNLTMNDVDCVAVGHSDPFTVADFLTDESYHKYFVPEPDFPDWYWKGWDLKMWRYIHNNYFNTTNNVLFVEGESRGQLFNPSKIKWYDHHECHIASTVIPSGFDECNYYVADGAGGETAGRIGHWDGENFNQAGYMHNGGTFGGFYSHITTALGFRKHSEEGKTMGLACWGERDEELLPKSFAQNGDGFVQPHTDYYKKYLGEDHLWVSHEATKVDANEPGDAPMTKIARDLAATGQSYLEEIIAYNIEHLNYSFNQSDNLALAGGTMLNCTSNGKLAQNTAGGIYIQPAAHDSGTALGAAILAHKELTGEWPRFKQDTAYYGRSWDSDQSRFIIDSYDLNFETFDYEQISEQLANFIDDDKVVGYFQGKSEIGPRALCHRSILANPTKADNLQRVNKIKRREWWRPLAPTMLEEAVYDITNSKHPSPFMLMACEVKPEWRERIPAVVHVDNSCRPQTVNENQNKIIYDALKLFSQKPNGVPVFMNTSFNIAEPLVDSPEDAIKTFINSDIDILIIENHIIKKEYNE